MNDLTPFARLMAELVNSRTQAEVAEAIDRTQQCVSLWLRGQSVPTVRHADFLGERLGVSPERFRRAIIASVRLRRREKTDRIERKKS